MPAMPGRERRGSMRDSPWEARRGALAWQNRDRWRSAPRRRNPPPCTSSILLLSPVLSPPCAGAFLRYACVLPRATPAPLLVLGHALRSTTLALSPTLRQRSTLHFDPALHWTTRVLYAGAGAIPFAL